MMTPLLSALLVASSLTTTAPIAAPAPPTQPPIEIADDASFRALAAQGEAAMRDSRWAEAAAAFDAAQQLLDEPMPELTYNKAVAEYRMGRYEEARAGFTDAIAQSRSPEILRDSVYNLGNTAHQRVVDSLQNNAPGDAQATIDQLGLARDQLGEALNHYREAIRTRSDDLDARANAELTWKLMEELRQLQEEMEQQQQQNQDQQSQDQQQQNQDQQSQDQQQQNQNQQSQDQQQQNQNQ
ncbi:MAG: hypothetical protein MK095_09855, partial [Phycisphaerales bacterium]|nr:hypothetical protein [Phycisphaerales bacterium]